MARNYGQSVAKADYNYRAEADKDSLLRAAEIVGDRIRLRDAMHCMRKQQTGMDRMLTVLRGRGRKK